MSAESSQYALHVEKLVHRYGDHLVFDEFNFSILKGTAAIVTGPNGIGKTTLFKILSTLIIPQNGTVLVNGYDVVRQASEVRKHVSCSFLNAQGLLSRLTVRENMILFGKRHGMQRNSIADAMKPLAPLLEDKWNLFPHELSSGMRQVVHLAKSFLLPANIVLLDEPYLALDSGRIGIVNSLLLDFINQGRCIVMNLQDSDLGIAPVNFMVHALNPKTQREVNV